MATETLNRAGKNRTQAPKAEPKKKVSGYTSKSEGSSSQEIARTPIDAYLNTGSSISKVYLNTNGKPFAWLRFSEALLANFDLGDDNDSVVVHFTGGAKGILAETGNKISKRMEIFEGESEDGETFFVMCAKGEEIGGGEGEIVD